jgi:Zn-dependent M28 family amino/carboxypeptidase
VLCELGRSIPELPLRRGVDFVFFDGEELVYDNQRDPYFLGSEHFARDYVANPPSHRYTAAVLLDMVGDRNLEIYIEQNSYRWPDSRPLVDSIWSTARRLGVREFIARPRHWINDDHLKLHDIAGIPSCDVIDFDYPRPGRTTYWHTTQDTPDKCSPASLEKVGRVMLEWLKGQ